MPVYEVLAPGVYIEEVQITPAIFGVGTSTTALIGVANNPKMPDQPDGTPYPLQPVEEWKQITSFEEFTRFFGKIDVGNRTLALSMRGYFNNGGTVCFVARVDSLTNGTAIDNVLLKLEAIDEVAIVAAPGALDAAIQLKIINHCEIKMKDRFAILDGQRTHTITKAAIFGSLATNSDWAALYFPYIEVSDPSLPGGNGTSFIPPSGLMAGIYARVDSERGVHKAPANVVVQDALGLEHLTSKNEQSVVNKDGVNVIRSFNGLIKVWGARTLGSADSAKLRYINVRRLIIFLSESIDESTQWVVFEPNSNPLWQKITRSVTAFLTRVWKDGALFGVEQKNAFYVKCDESTNPKENRAVGIVTTEIGVAPVKPAEFVVFRIAQFEEIPTP